MLPSIFRLIGYTPAVNECPNCYHEIDITMEECPNCGQRIGDISPFGAT